MNTSFYFTTLLMLFCSTARVQADAYPYLYRSGSFLGRGDTGIATADDEDAIFYNPAGVAYGKGVFKKIVIASPTIEVSTDTRDVVRQISLQDSDPTETMRNHEGKGQHAGLYNFTGIVLRKVALGVFGHGEATALLFKDPAQGGFESISANAVADAGATFTLASAFFSKQAFVGVTGKYIQRTQGALTANATETDRLKKLQSDELAMTGTGTGADFGFMYRGEGRSPVSFGLTVQDIGDTKFIPKAHTELSKKDRPIKDIKQTVNVGFAVEPGTKVSRFKIMADFRDAAGNVETSVPKRIHVGGELTVRDFVGFSAGLNQGYGTFGFYFDLHVFRLDLGTYTEEIGARAGSRPDERFFIKITAGL